MPVSRRVPEINAGSMADIAFLLLVFFLVSTNIEQDAGIKTRLPAHVDVPPAPRPERNVLMVQLNAANQLLVEGERESPFMLASRVETFLLHEADAPNKAIVSLKGDRLTSYEAYIEVHDLIRHGYRSARDQYAQIQFGRPVAELDEESREDLRDQFPMMISEAEPTDFGQVAGR